MIDWRSPTTYRTTVCRPALPKDTRDVLAFSRKIWDGEDYVPDVWETWLHDPDGLLAIAEHGGRVVGLGKLSLLAPDEWWLEGLRVDPAYEGRGIASHLNDYLLNHWGHTGKGTVRLVTSSTRLPVHHLCERSGFQRVLELIPYAASSNISEASFKMVKPEELVEAEQFAHKAASVQASAGLLDNDWQWVRVAAWNLAGFIQDGKLWCWQSEDGAGRGLVGGRQSSDGRKLVLALVATSWKYLAECLQNVTCLAGSTGYHEVGWWAPTHVRLAAALQAAGYLRDWENNSLYMYQKLA